MKSIVLLTSFIFIFLLSSFAQENSDDWKISGQIQLRGELDGRDFSSQSDPIEFVSLRTRVSVQKGIAGLLNFFVQFQDSRLFGQTQNTLASISNIDLHQGYVELNNVFDLPFAIQGGRFEATYGTERFLGAVGWHYIGRAWDGFRIKYDDAFKLDIFGLTQSESAVYIGNANPSVYSFPNEAKTSSRVIGLWSTFGSKTSNRVDVFGYYESDNAQNTAGEKNLQRFTTGLNLAGTYGIFNAITEAAYQFGKKEGVTILSYLVSFQVGFTKDWWKIGGGVDIVSGNDPKKNFEKVNVFDPAFGTNHKFYGYMDYFINIPSNTLQLGLNDFYGSIGINPIGSKFSFTLDFHHFTSNKSYNVSNTAQPVFIDIFGQEIDLTIKYNFIKGTVITLGGSTFIPGDLMSLVLFKPREDIAYWSYLMITTNI